MIRLLDIEPVLPDEDVRKLQEGLASMQATLDGMRGDLKRINGRLHEAEKRLNQLDGAQGRVSSTTVWMAVSGLAGVGMIAVALIVGLS